MSQHCPPGDHAFTPLHSGWEPDVTSPCDCGGSTFGEYQRAQMAAALQVGDGGGCLTAAAQSADPAPGGASILIQREKWDIARADLRCQRQDCVIAAGEPYRRLTKAGLKYCVACAKHVTGEDPPSDLPILRVVDQLAIPDAVKKFVTPALPHSMTRFDRPLVQRAIKRAVVDVRQRQAASDTE